MAKPVSEEELQLKKRARRRLIGAIALVAAVAAILPMVLDSEPKPTSQEVSIQIPPPGSKGGAAVKPAAVPPAAKPEAKAESKPQARPPETPVASAAPVTAVSPVEKPVAKTTEAVPAKSAEKPASMVAAGTPDKALAKAIERATERGAESASDKTSAKAAEKAPEKAAAPKAAPGSFFIQVMALSDADKARQSQRKMVDAGVRAYTEQVTAGGAPVTRVRAGPFATREEADKAQTKLQGLGFDGKVAAY